MDLDGLKCATGLFTFDDNGNVVQTVMMKSEIDEKIMREIASATGGEYFRATSEQTLQLIYEQIDAMEKSKVEVSQYTVLHEEYLPYVLAALAALVLEFVMRYLILKRIP